MVVGEFYVFIVMLFRVNGLLLLIIIIIILYTVVYCEVLVRNIGKLGAIDRSLCIRPR